MRQLGLPGLDELPVRHSGTLLCAGALAGGDGCECPPSGELCPATVWWIPGVEYGCLHKAGHAVLHVYGTSHGILVTERSGQMTARGRQPSAADAPSEEPDAEPADPDEAPGGPAQPGHGGGPSDLEA